MDHIWYWFAYSFLGYCLEKLFAAATRSSHRLRRCFVFLPLCPVYGFAMVTILLLGAEKLPGAWEQILLGMLMATAMEYAVHWGYERLFQVQFWDYSSTKCDVNGRICLPFSSAGEYCRCSPCGMCSRFWRAMPHCFQSGPRRWRCSSSRLTAS